MKRVILLANHNKTQVIDALAELRPWLNKRAQIVFEANTDNDSTIKLPDADLVLMLGGDGTLLSQARRIVDASLPIVGVNFGKLGFLAEFNLDELQEHWNDITSGTCPISERLMLKANICPHDSTSTCFESLALNDCAITPGPPFRMIELELKINPQQWKTDGTNFKGDGVVVSSPSGSTAYNVSAGGPILSPVLNAMVITPVSPHSLSFKPIVTHGSDTISIELLQANKGTTLVIDGQHTEPLHVGSTININAHDKRLRLVLNPSMSFWKRLAKKMNWALGPNQR